MVQMMIHDLKNPLNVILNLLFVNSSIGLRTSVPGTCWINSDMHIVNRIFTNLLSNAIKYTPSGGEIHIIATQKDEEILIEIQDNGIGIPEENIDSLFEMYAQGENMEVMYNSSTGIGLSYCRLAVDALGGRIGIKSEVGKGIRYIFL